MIDISDKAMCCGCNACGDVCAHDAITFKTDIEGFWYPEVDKSKCTDCGLCEKVCPIINIDTLKKNNLKQSIQLYYYLGRGLHFHNNHHLLFLDKNK